jgi:hypothetical protein
MATYYVDSNATGLNDGSSWTDAWTSIASAASVAAGDDVLVADNHYQGMYPFPQFANGDPNNPIRVISSNKTSGSYSAGATLEELGGGAIGGGSVSFFGFEFRIQYGLVFQGSSALPRGDILRFTGCNFSNSRAASMSLNLANYLDTIYFQSCNFQFTNAVRFKTNSFAQAEIFADDCVFNNFTTFIEPLSNHERNPVKRLINCSLPDTDYIISAGASTEKIELHHCNLKSGFSLFSGTPHSENVIVVNSHVGALSNPQVGITKVGSAKGEVATSITAYRSSGANNGTQDFSWTMVSTSVAKENKVFLEAIPITKYVESGSQTITVYVAGGASLNDDDFWIEVESPSEEVSPTAQGKFRTTKPDPLAIPTALTSDTSSTWNGTGVGTKQKIEVAISPTIAGTVTVKCYLAKPSTTVYVDPKISTTGNQRVFNGVLVDGDAAPSGGGGATVHPLRSN